MAEPGEGPGGSYPPPPLFLDQLRPEGPKKNWGDRASPLSQGLDDRPPSLFEALQR